MSAQRCLREYLTARLMQDSALVAACADRLGPGALPRGTAFPYQYWLNPPAVGTLALGGGVVRHEYRLQIGVAGLAIAYDQTAELQARQGLLLGDYFRPTVNQYGTVAACTPLGAAQDIPDESEDGKPIVRVADVYVIALHVPSVLAPPASLPEVP